MIGCRCEIIYSTSNVCLFLKSQHIILLGTTEQPDDDTALHESQLRQMYHPKSRQESWKDWCQPRSGSAALQWCAWRNSNLQTRFPQQDSLSRVQAEVDTRYWFQYHYVDRFVLIIFKTHHIDVLWQPNT